VGKTRLFADPPAVKPQPEDWNVPGTKYNCFNCDAMCCSLYERVPVSDEDQVRLAAHFNLTVEQIQRRYTRRIAGERLLKRKQDERHNETCIFLNPHTRLCGVHEARPDVCRQWPPRKTRGRCPYYDALQFERWFQQDPDAILTIQVSVTTSTAERNGDE